MNICKKVAENLLLYRDGTLPEEEMQFLRQHLQYCPPCLLVLEGYEEVLDVLQRLKPVNMPPDLMERMQGKLQDELGRE
jgi:hypothetical protein